MRIRGRGGLRSTAETEAALLNMGFRDAYALRPGFIQPMRGVTSRVRSVRWLYALTQPMYPFLQKRFRRFVTSTDLLAAAMLQLALAGSPKKTLNTSELNGIAKHVPVTVTTTLAKQEVEALPTKPRDCGQLLSA